MIPVSLYYKKSKDKTEKSEANFPDEFIFKHNQYNICKQILTKYKHIKISHHDQIWIYFTHASLIEHTHVDKDNKSLK